jgi:membrane-associated phospholipid phosphatase
MFYMNTFPLPNYNNALVPCPLSFPSGHSMMSAITYLALGALLARSQERKRLKAYFFLLAALLTFMIGVSRVYLGVHWPTDVLAGWTAGQCGRCSAGLRPGGFRVVARSSGRQNTPRTRLAELREVEIAYWPRSPVSC